MMQESPKQICFKAVFQFVQMVGRRCMMLKDKQINVTFTIYLIKFPFTIPISIQYYYYDFKTHYRAKSSCHGWTFLQFRTPIKLTLELFHLGLYFIGLSVVLSIKKHKNWAATVCC